MDERPSFQRRTDLRRLIIALLTPWILSVLAYSLPLLARELHRSGFRLDWYGPVLMIWYIAFQSLACLSMPAWFLFGVWRLIWRPEYRRSWYGWMWLFLIYMNLPLVMAVFGK